MFKDFGESEGSEIFVSILGLCVVERIGKGMSQNPYPEVLYFSCSINVVFLKTYIYLQ